jgi:hypothetical protein
MSDPLAIHRLRLATDAAEALKANYTKVRVSDLRWMLEAWDEVVVIISAEAKDTSHAHTAGMLEEALTTMGQL